MAPEVMFLSELRGKTVLTEDGELLGKLDNVEIDTETGEIKHLLVVTEGEAEAAKKGFERDSKGRLKIPFKNMKAIKDVIMIEVGKKGFI
ncbi:MAG: PRC-barrel domain protein [Thermoplasmata archaeon]|nr:PRC-barrel domain-containing protein [Thermoplasmata archaeon]RLF29568.1 MAG: PRC-barrel domain protein [Thermoplasmata archaeon]HDJ27179.1 PRC-barrel domain protein [Aciduliprofundum sp.]